MKTWFLTFAVVYCLTMLLICLDYYLYLKDDTDVTDIQWRSFFKMHWSAYLPVFNTIMIMVCYGADLYTYLKRLF